METCDQIISHFPVENHNTKFRFSICWRDEKENLFWDSLQHFGFLW